MAQSVTAAFLAAQKADAAKYAYKVQLVLGDYANGNAKIGGFTPTASANGSRGLNEVDISGNFPIAGAINGDRTELNVGAASGADNGVGLASWRSLSVVTPGGFVVWYMINFGTTRTFNRVKVYNLSNLGLVAYKLQSSNDGTTWTDIPGASIAGGATTGGRVDTLDFADVTASWVRVYITDANNGQANIVEVEVYRKVDVTNRVISISPSRQRDYKLKNPIASTVSVRLDNTDQFFSFSYTPTAAQVAAGYVNSEIRPNISIIVQMGFKTAAAPTGELVTVFTGKLDRISVRSKSQTCVLTSRDSTKRVINQTISTKLKQTQRIDQIVQYVLNLANFSTWEMTVQAVNITLPYFFVYQTSVMTVLQQLAQASVTCTFFLDEFDTPTFTTVGKNQQVVYTKADWDAGTVKTNVDTGSTAGSIQRGWYLIDNFADGEHSSNPAWTNRTIQGGSITDVVGKITLACPTGGAKWASLDTPITKSAGTWSFKVTIVSNSTPANSNNGDGFEALFFLTTTIATGGGGATVTGYALRFNLNTGGGASNQVELVRYDNTAVVNGTVLASCGTFDNSAHAWNVSRDLGGNFTVYKDGVSVGTATDLTYTSGAYLGLSCETINSTASVTADTTDIYWSAETLRTAAVTNAQAVYESVVIDQGAGIAAEGIFSAIYDTPHAGTSLAFYTATSADNITYSAYAAVTPGQAIPSAVNRYLKFKIVFTAPEDDGAHNTYFYTPIVYQVTVTWLNSNNLALRYDTTIMEVANEQADDLGGDTSIYNDLTVSGAPLVLSGANTDTQWQMTAGSPPAAVSASIPYSVNAGTIKIQAAVTGGMDTSRMSGASPAAVAITFGTAVGTYSISYIHPTQPVIQLVITTPGTITDLRLIGKAFTAATTQIQSNVKNTASIALYDDRAQSIQNNYIVSYATAVVIATTLVNRYASPTSYIPQLENLLLLSAQIGDVATVTDNNTGLSKSMTIVGLQHELGVSRGKTGQARSVVKLLL